MELYRAFWATTFVRGSVAFVKGEAGKCNVQVLELVKVTM